MLVVKILHFNISATHSVRIPEGEALGLCSSVLLERAAIFDHEQNKCLQECPQAAFLVWREEINVRSKRVSSTHSWRVKCSR